MSNYQNAVNSTSYGCLESGDVLPDPQPVGGSKLPYTVNITPLDHGFIVNVGCQSFAMNNVEDMMNKIEAYLKNPKEIERLWFEKKDLTLIK